MFHCRFNYDYYLFRLLRIEFNISEGFCVLTRCVLPQPVKCQLIDTHFYCSTTVCYSLQYGHWRSCLFTRPRDLSPRLLSQFRLENGSSVPLFANQDFYDGVNFFLSETDPSLFASYGATTFMYLPNTLVFGFHNLYNELYACEWDTPPMNPSSIHPPYAPFFRRQCQTSPNKIYNFACDARDRAINFIISFNSATNQTTVGSSAGSLTVSLPRSAKPVKRYMGISAISSAASSQVTEYITPDTRVSALGQASVDATQKKIFLTKSQNGVGLVVLRDYAVLLNQSFTLNFRWTVLGTIDQSATGDGFALFLTRPRREIEALPTGSSLGSGLGIQSRPNTTIIGFDRVLNQYYLCTWTTPPDNAALQSFCSTFTSPLPPVTPNQTLTFEVRYNQDLFEVYANNEFLFASVLVLPKTEPYTIGFSGASGASNITQYISEWSKTLTDPPTTSYVLNITDFVSFGGASIASDKVQITNNGTGVAVYKTPLPARLGFTTSFQWKPTNCTSDSGFTFLLTTTPPSDITVSSDNNNSAGYGTSLLSRLISLSLNFTSSQFTAYFNSTLTSAATYTSLVNLTSVRCTDFIDIRIEYTSTNLVRLYMANQLVASINDTANTIINPSLYYFGLSGVEGSFTRWNATTTTISNKRQFSYSFSNEVINTLGTASVVSNTLRLTTGGSESGVAYYPLPLYAHTGFHSTLTWKPTNCDAANNGADGFTLFLSKDRPQFSDVYMSSGGLLGVGSVPNLTMIAYSATYNEFYICNWTSPLTDNFRWVCNYVLPFSGPKMTCSNSYIFEHNFDGRLLTLAVNGTQIFTTQLTLDPVPYFVGLSGATGGGYFQQDVSNWTFDSTAV